MILWRSCWQWYWCSRTCPFLGQKQNTSPFFWGKCIARNSYRQKIHISGHVCSVKHRQDCWRRRLLRIGPDFKEFVLQLLAKFTIVFLFRINTIYLDSWNRKEKERENGNCQFGQNNFRDWYNFVFWSRLITNSNWLYELQLIEILKYYSQV